jgi:hypothetical protein
MKSLLANALLKIFGAKRLSTWFPHVWAELQFDIEREYEGRMNAEQLDKFKEMFPDASKETLVRMEAAPTAQIIVDIFNSMSEKKLAVL